MVLEKQGDVYLCGDLSLRPQPPEGVLVKVYADWKSTNVLDLCFYGEPTSLQFFLNWFTSLERSNLGAYKQLANGSYQALGLVWINNTFELPGGFTRAEVAMGFCRGVTPAELKIVGAMAVEWGFKERELDALIGTTPAPNKAAVRYGKKLGFSLAGPVHGMCTWHGNMESVYIQSMTKDQWAKISPFEDPSNIGQPEGV